MTQEDKELLLKDLCSRLPYGVILLSPNGKVTYQTDGNTAAELLVEEGWKPYLRPMSSLAEEEKKEFHHIASLQRNYLGDDIFYTHWQMYDWLNKHHFDFRNLIERGLAIAVTEENNPYKE